MFKIFTLLAWYGLFLFITKVEGRDNDEIKLNCWPSKLKYKTFDISVTLSTRNKIDQIIGPNVTFSPKDLDFDPKRKTVVITHGLATSNEHSKQLKSLRDALLKLADLNVVSVDWTKGCSNFLKYFQAVVNTKYAAYTLKDVMSYTIGAWRAENNFDAGWMPELHFVGFSLGAHVVGQAAELLKLEDGVTVPRITGLDPAGPCFEPPDFELRLSKANGLFVDVVHTDGALTENEAFGLYDPIGHVDFYVNGGRKQPGCGFLGIEKSISSLFKLLLHAIENGVCSHRRGFKVFLESVNQAVLKQCTFSAYPWIIKTPFNASIEKDTGSWPEMGINADLYKYTDSTYYVPTSDKSPFCENEN